MAYAQWNGSSWRARWQAPPGHKPAVPGLSGFLTKKDAEHYAQDREAEIRAGTYVDPEQGKRFLDDWWGEWFAAQELTDNTEQAYKQAYRLRVAPRWGKVRLSDIRPIAVQTWEKETRQSSGRSSAATAISVMRQLMDSAAENRLIGFSPAPRRKKRPTTYGQDPRPGMVVDWDTVDAIRARLSPDLSLLVLTKLITGMRWGEVAGIRRSFLTLHQAVGEKPASGYYTIDKLIGAVKEDEAGRRYFGPPKSGRGRVVDLPPFLVVMLLEYIRTLPEQQDLLWVNRNGRAHQHCTWLKQWHLACDGRPARVLRGVPQSAVPPVAFGLLPHDLRHTAETDMIGFGTSQPMRDDRIGHKAPGMQGVYAHPTAMMRARLMEDYETAWFSHRTAAELFVPDTITPVLAPTGSESDTRTAMPKALTLADAPTPLF
jgi:integrase